MANIRKFPKDCNKDCEYFRCWDLSVDDLTCYCEKAKTQIDLCDCDFQYVKCPLGIEVKD